jgi:hypothetical protein
MEKYIIIISTFLSVFFLSVCAGKTVEKVRIVLESRYEKGDTAIAVSRHKK